MSNFHRIIWINNQIKGKRYPDRQKIADKFEISIRQVARDIDYMKYSMGAPIEYSSLYRGYYYKDKTYVLPGHFLSSKDKKMLNYLAFKYRNYGSGQAAELAKIFGRLAREKEKDDIEDKDANRIPVYRVSGDEPDFFQDLKEAILQKQKVSIKYINSSYQESRRIFCPYKIFYNNFHNYVVGYCELREEIRIFRLDTIKELRLSEEKFSVVSYFDVGKYNNQYSFDFREPYQAIICFEEQPIDMSFIINHKSSEDYIIQFYDSAGLISELLALDYEFKIKRPQWLKEKLLKKIKKISKKHQV